MKTAITSSGNQVHAAFDKRFGRAAWFCIYDEQTEETVFHMNHGRDDSGGAGTRAAQKMVELGVGKVISGDFGPKAKELLEKLNIQMVILRDDPLEIGEIITKLKHL
jgi:predicted Fe-Mo cluster-binding NifX family protein